MLYQLSYGCIVFSIAGAKVRTIFETTKHFSKFFRKKCKKGSKTVFSSLFSCLLAGGAVCFAAVLLFVGYEVRQAFGILVSNGIDDESG
ncbi:MAG: hypothetical protein K2O48_01340, partial [Prevotella sp.]|nr:hypothetical protein [Prevotella sp.]